MASSFEYNGFMIEPLIYPLPRVRDSDSARLDLRYQVSVRLTPFDSEESSLSRLVRPGGFSCLGDARRAAESFGRHLVDTPPDAPAAALRATATPRKEARHAT